MMPYIYVVILVSLALAQSTIVPATALGSTKPFLPLVAVVSWVLLRGPVSGAWWALAVGLTLDAISPIPGSFYTLPLLVAVGVVAIGRGRFFPQNIIVPWVFVGVATAVFLLTQRAMIPLSGGTVSWSVPVLAHEIVPEAALNLLWLPLLYLPLRALSRRTAGPRIDWEG